MEEHPIPFAGWMQVDKEETEEMLRHQIHILGDMIRELTEENMRLKMTVHNLESQLYGGSVL